MREIFSRFVYLQKRNHNKKYNYVKKNTFREENIFKTFQHL